MVCARCARSIVCRPPIAAYWSPGRMPCTQAYLHTSTSRHWHRGTLYPALQSASTECAAAQKVACHVHCSVGKWRQGQGARKLCSNRIFTRGWKCNFFKVSVHALGAWYTWSLSDTIGSWYSILARHCFTSGSPAGWPKLKTIGCKVNWQKVSGVQQPFKWLSVMSAENNLKSLPAALLDNFKYYVLVCEHTINIALPNCNATEQVFD